MFDEPSASYVDNDNVGGARLAVERLTVPEPDEALASLAGADHLVLPVSLVVRQSR